MERRSDGWTLIDGCFSDLGGPRTSSLLEQLDQFVPWDQLAEPIRATYQNGSASGGRPSIPVVVMVKAVVLQKLYGLSDPGIEEALLDRISFRRFVGLGMSDPTPDETSFVRFRNRLIRHGLGHDMFETVKTHLESQGLIVHEGTAVDATIIQAPRGRDQNGKPSDTADRAATQTAKRGRPYFGYKAHVATDMNGVITDYVFDTASVADARHMEQLTRDETQAVFADSAYMDKKRRAALEQRGVFYGIIERRVRGQAALTAEQRAHNRLCSKFRAVVEHPFAQMKNTGSFDRVRYRGVTRNAMDFCLMAITLNLRRGISLLKQKQEDERWERTAWATCARASI